MSTTSKHYSLFTPSRKEQQEIRDAYLQKNLREVLVALYGDDAHFVPLLLKNKSSIRRFIKIGKAWEKEVLRREGDTPIPRIWCKYTLCREALLLSVGQRKPRPS
jgi:hypothetical protein